MSQSAPIYAIHEHFYSVQGEGIHTGRAAYFIRLMGCDQKCGFCDSAGTWHKDWLPKSKLKCNAHEAARLTKPAPTGAFVVLTGGEPTLYNLQPLVDELQGMGRLVHIETAGHHFIPGTIDWVTLSPKFFADPPRFDSWTRADEVKLIVESPEQLMRDLAKVESAPLKHRCTVWLHPEWSKRHDPNVLGAILDLVKKRPYLRAGYQIHKLYNADLYDPNASREIIPLGGTASGGIAPGGIIPLESK